MILNMKDRLIRLAIKGQEAEIRELLLKEIESKKFAICNEIAAKQWIENVFWCEEDVVELFEVSETEMETYRDAQRASIESLKEVAERWESAFLKVKGGCYE